jgi:hypothetical protein
MNALSIAIPQIEGEQDIEIDIRINGKQMQYNYRVEIFHWSDCQVLPSQFSHVECIRKIIADYDPEWQLVSIGMPTDEYVPMTFQRKRPTVIKPLL